jgi:hypothetical protein
MRTDDVPGVVRIDRHGEVVVAFAAGLPTGAVLDLARVVLTRQEYTDLERQISNPPEPAL